EATPNRGAMVCSHDAEDLDDLYQLRALLEGFAARQAAARITDDELTRLRLSCVRFDKLDPADDPRKLVKENLFFHNAILEIAGVRVIELGMLLAGPFTGRLLGDMGAEIIKIEPPGKPDPLREWGKARYEGRSLWWPVQSRNKKCCTLNLREQKGQELLRELVKRSDVLVENFRPGTLERWNLGPAQLWEVNPRLVVARVSGYGQTGPYADRAGFASVAEAMGGIRYINGF